MKISNKEKRIFIAFLAAIVTFIISMLFFTVEEANQDEREDFKFETVKFETAETTEETIETTEETLNLESEEVSVENSDTSLTKMSEEITTSVKESLSSKTDLTIIESGTFALHLGLPVESIYEIPNPVVTEVETTIPTTSSEIVTTVPTTVTTIEEITSTKETTITSEDIVTTSSTIQNVSFVKTFSRGTYYCYGCPKKGGSGRQLIDCSTGNGTVKGSIASSYLYRHYGYNYNGKRTMVYLEIANYSQMNGYYYLDDSDAGNSNVIDFFYIYGSNCPFSKAGVVTVDCYIVN